MADNDHVYPDSETSRNSGGPDSGVPSSAADMSGTPPPMSKAQSPTSARRGGPDPVTLTAGLLTLAVAVHVLIGGPWSLHWVLAIGAVGIGAAMLIASLRPRHDR
ncbi:hypothetical protein [Haloactinomyces albus]|uniref:Fatty acid desaturase n=1 Tax=Haloactinomyces albus TaxID=1352928 RepID=A0AAE4CQD3_9ACTN|nr:hypothetical protein [Haloactinomyces albus]MDR7302563.1 fatty acid desaturase [Haloactinomyces albus]